MKDQPPPSRHWIRRATILALALLVLTGAGYLFLTYPSASLPAVTLAPAATEATPEQVHQFCGACHAYPPAETFPKSAWRRETCNAPTSNLQLPASSLRHPPAADRRWAAPG